MYLHNSNPILIIARPKLNGFGEHWGVRFADSRVAHYTAEYNFQVTSEDGFAQGKDVRIVRVVPLHLNQEVMRRLGEISRNPRPYHATDWNCEIFANWVTNEQPVSQQVTGWALLGLIAGIAAIAAKA